MHLVTYSNHDTEPFLLIVPIKGRLSEMQFIVSLFINACTISLLFLKIFEILCTFHYIRMEFPILVRGHFSDTVERFHIETLFIIIERYVKLYIF